MIRTIQEAPSPEAQPELTLGIAEGLCEVLHLAGCDVTRELLRIAVNANAVAARAVNRRTPEQLAALLLGLVEQQEALARDFTPPPSLQ